MPVADLFLKAIIDQINQYVRSVSTFDPTIVPVVLGNIATAEIAGGNNGHLNEKIVASLVNIEEEGSLKNKVMAVQQGQQSINFSPPVYVNLYFLFTANFEAYDTAISFLFRIIEFFQSKKIFKLKNTPSAIINETDALKLSDIEIIFDLYTLSFEQLNNLWGSLGGKQIPFVLYRARLIPVFIEQPAGRSGLISEIDVASTQLSINQ